MAVAATPVEEGSEEEQRQVEGLYASLQSLFAGVDDVVTGKTIAVFMASVMVQSDNWKNLIPGFMNHMDICANSALTHHQREERNAKQKESSNEDGDAEAPKEQHRSVEGEG